METVIARTVMVVELDCLESVWEVAEMVTVKLLAGGVEGAV